MSQTASCSLLCLPYKRPVWTNRDPDRALCFKDYILEQLSRALQRNRRKHGSSRRWAIKARKSVKPVSDSQVKIKKTQNDPPETELVVETRPRNSVELVSSSGGGFFFNAVRNRVSQVWTNVRSFFFFWRAYAQRVEVLHQRMEELQSELRLLRSNGLMPQGCKCNCGQSDDVKPQQHQLSSVAPPLLPPPPPPPPPLPLPPTPSAPTIKAPEKPSIPKKRTQSTLQEKQDGCAVVTLKDLQAVQLRKVSAHKKIRSPDGTRSPLITLADLQKVRLRRTQFSITTPTRRSLSLSRTPSPVKLHLQLRKVHSVRRSGNTPLCNKENVMKE